MAFTKNLRSVIPLNERYDYDFPVEVRKENFAHLVEKKDFNRHYAVKNDFEHTVATSFMKTSFSKVVLHDGEMRVTLYIESFEKKNFDVSVKDNYVVIEGKHEDRIDSKNPDHTIARRLVREYPLPRNCNRDEIRAEINNEKLTVIVPCSNFSYNRNVEIKECQQNELYLDSSNIDFHKALLSVKNEAENLLPDTMLDANQKETNELNLSKSSPYSRIVSGCPTIREDVTKMTGTEATKENTSIKDKADVAEVVVDEKEKTLKFVEETISGQVFRIQI